MKFSIFVFACLLASAVSTPIDRKVSEIVSGAPKNSTTASTPIESTTVVKPTDAPSTVPSETTTVVKDDSTTAIVEVTTASTQQETTETTTTIVPSTSTISSSTTVSTPKPKVKTVDSKVEPAPVVVETSKKSPDARKGRGSKKFNMVENPEEKPVEKPKKEEKPQEKIPEPEQKPEEEPKDEKVEEKKPQAHEEKQPEQKKPKETVDDESIPAVSGKVVPAVAQPRLLSPEARRKGRKYKDIQIVQLESELEENGKYHYKYENEDGTIVHQSGEMKMMDHDGEKMMGESVEGSYSYKDDDGNTISVSYTADENGFRPVGAHIPTIPPAIARSLAWQATAKPWVDPWVVEQEELRKARKLTSKSDE